MSKAWSKLFTFSRDPNQDLERPRDSVELMRRGDEGSSRSPDIRNENLNHVQQQPITRSDQADGRVERTRKGKFVIQCKIEISAGRTTFKTQSPRVGLVPGNQLAAARSELKLSQHDASGGPSEPEYKDGEGDDDDDENEEDDNEKMQEFENAVLLGDFWGGTSGTLKKRPGPLNPCNFA